MADFGQKFLFPQIWGFSPFFGGFDLRRDWFDNIYIIRMDTMDITTVWHNVIDVDVDPQTYTHTHTHIH